MEDQESWDAIVVGAGIGGLVCAGYLAADGARVLVLEQHDVVGGSAHVFRRRRRYEFDVGVHYLGDCGPDGILPAIFSGLGLKDRIQFLPMDADGFDRIMLPSVTMDVPTGWDRYRQRLREALPAETAGVDAFVERCVTVAELARSSLISPHQEVMDLARKMPTDLRWSRRTLAELFDHCGLSARARTLLAAQSGGYGAPPSDISVGTHACLVDHYLRGAYYPAGGGQVMVASLVEVLEAHGGEVRTRCPVRRIRIEDKRATGVELANGRVLHAPLIISNADYRSTILELGGAENFPPAIVSRTREATMRLPLAVVYVALDRPMDHLPNANIWWWRGEDVDEAYGRLWNDDTNQEVPFLFFSFASNKDPGAAACPPGHSNFQVMAVCPPGYASWGGANATPGGKEYRRRSGYRATKERITEAILDAAETAIGPFRENIAHLEAATPLTHHRYTLASGGTPYGMGRWGSVGQRPDTATAVSGLYVVGPSTRYGSGIAGVAISGIECAGQIIGRPLLREMYHGARIVDPASLPTRPPGWDPLAISRGTGRRTARGLARIGR